MNDKFEFKYDALSSEEKKEVDSIRKQYFPKNEKEAKLERLKQLDKKVKNIPVIISLSMGIIGVLMFGLGLTFFLEWKDTWYFGIIFAPVGIIIGLFAYPVYNKSHILLRKKYGAEIIEISNQLLDEE